MNQTATIVPKGRSVSGVFWAATLAHMSIHFAGSVNILFPVIMQDLNLNYTMIGFLTGMSSFITVPLQLAYTVIPRYVARCTLLGITSVLSSLSFFLTGLANNFQQLFGARAVSYLALSGHDSLQTSILADKHEKKQLSSALSLHYAFAYLANTIGPLILSYLAVIFLWRQATMLFGAVPLVIGLATALYLRGDKCGEKTAKTATDSKLWIDIRSAFRIKGVLAILVAGIFAWGGPSMTVVSTYIPLFLSRGLNVGAIETSWVYSSAIVGGILGTIFFGRLARKLGNLLTLVTLIGSGTVLDFLLIFQKSFGILTAIHLFLVGFSSYAMFSLMQAHLATVATTPRQRDILCGLLFAFSWSLSPIISTLTGYLIDVHKTFDSVWIFKAALGMVAFSILTFALISTRQPEPLSTTKHLTTD
ncbi:MAG: MFS transporter [archaeon]